MKRLHFAGQIALAYFLTLTGGAFAANTSHTNLHEAIDADDTKAVSIWLESGADVDALIAGETALYRSAKSGAMDTLRLLLPHADPNGPVPGNRRPIMAAAYYGHLDAVSALLAAGADPELDADNGYATFDYALEGQRTEIMTLLLETWLKEDDLDPVEKQSLELTIQVIRNDQETLESRIQSGLSPDHHNRTGYAPLPLAVRLRRDELVDSLLKAGANPNIGNDGNDEALPLNQAARGGHLDLVAKLLEAGAEPDRGNARGYTALMLAAMYERQELIPTLLASSADPARTNDEGFTAIDYAVQRGNPQLLVSLLANWGAESAQARAIVHGDESFSFAAPETRSPWGYSDLALAARYGHRSLVDRFLEFGADPNAQNSTGYRTRPLIDAARNGYTEIAKTLIDAGAETTAADGHGDPAINWATYYGHQPFVELLLKHGADPTQASDTGYTALRTAEEQGHAEILALLEEHVRAQKPNTRSSG